MAESISSLLPYHAQNERSASGSIIVVRRSALIDRALPSHKHSVTTKLQTPVWHGDITGRSLCTSTRSKPYLTFDSHLAIPLSLAYSKQPDPKHNVAGGGEPGIKGRAITSIQASSPLETTLCFRSTASIAPHSQTTLTYRRSRSITAARCPSPGSRCRRG